MCIRQRYAPASATTPASSGSRAQRGDVVHQLDAELERLARDLRLGRVDRDRPALRAPRAPGRRGGAPRRARPAPRPGASTRRRRRRAPRRRRAWRRAAAAASRGRAYGPPSEKVSGVTLTIPITDGRVQTFGERWSSHRTWTLTRRDVRVDRAYASRSAPGRCVGCSCCSVASPRSGSSQRGRRAAPTGPRTASRDTPSQPRSSSSWSFSCIVLVGAWLIFYFCRYERRRRASAAEPRCSGDRVFTCSPSRSSWSDRRWRRS